LIFVTNIFDDGREVSPIHNAPGCGIFLDVKLDNLVYIILVNLVSTQLGIWGFEFIQRAQFFEFFDRGGATAYYARHRVLSENFLLSN